MYHYYKRAIISPIAKRHLNGVLMLVHFGSLVIFRGLANIAKKPYIFVISQEEGGGASGTPAPPSGSAQAV